MRRIRIDCARAASGHAAAAPPSNVRKVRRPSMQAFNKRPSVDQVGRAEAFRELIINGLQQCQGLIAATLALPEGHEIARRA